MEKLENTQILDKLKRKSYIKRFISFLIGTFLIALSYNIFLASNHLVPGGVGGIAIILNYFFGLNNSTVILIFNIFLIILSYLLLGKEKTKATLLGALLFPIFVSLTQNATSYIDVNTDELLLSSVFGGVLYGFGAGIVFKAGFTTGGTDILNQILSKYFKLSMGKSMLITDGCVVLFSTFAFGVTHLMYSIVALYIISLMSDRVILGISDSKAFYIVTEKDEEIKKFVIEDLNHGVTIFKAKGGYRKENKNVLMTILPTKDYYKLKNGLQLIDSEAFFVVTDAYEVFGGE